MIEADGWYTVYGLVKWLCWTPEVVKWAEDNVEYASFGFCYRDDGGVI